MARRPKLNQEITDRICGALVRGASMQAAAAEASIGYSTLKRWLAKGREEDAEELYSEFYAEVEEATNRSEIHLLEKIRAAEDWRASAWILSRRFPDRWSEKRSVEVSTNDRPDGAAMVASMLAQLREEHEEGAGDE
jgi:transposase